ncbi:MAG: class I SAM-dependent methyltransferase [Planctomycetota bacterium]
MPIGDRSRELYDPRFVAQLFDGMSRTYGVVNLISSFGFAWRWRHQCTRLLQTQGGDCVVDLMSGMGELWSDLVGRVGGDGSVIGIDISEAMCDASTPQRLRLSRDRHVMMARANALSCPIADGSVDGVISTFGLKTFNAEQLDKLAHEAQRILKPGGSIAMLEISVPTLAALRWPYMFYLEVVVPMIGWLLLGNPDHYRLLGVYTRAFGDCRDAAERFRRAGLEIEDRSFFFRCATGFTGRKPTVTQ